MTALAPLLSLARTLPEPHQSLFLWELKKLLEWLPSKDNLTLDTLARYSRE